MEKIIRIWDGCKVIQVVSVRNNGSSTTIGSVGGAENSIKVDIELDPWAGLIVDHSVEKSPVRYREEQF